MRRIHYESGIMINANVVCGRHHSNGRMLRTTTNKRRVTCKCCRAWLRLVFPRSRRTPLAKRKLHLYNILTGFGPRCGMRGGEAFTIGTMANVTCGRCRRLLGLRPWRPKLIRPNCELVDITIVRTGATITHRIDRNEMRRTQPASEFV